MAGKSPGSGAGGMATMVFGGATAGGALLGGEAPGRSAPGQSSGPPSETTFAWGVQEAGKGGVPPGVPKAVALHGVHAEWSRLLRGGVASGAAAGGGPGGSGGIGCSSGMHDRVCARGVKLGLTMRPRSTREGGGPGGNGGCCAFGCEGGH